MSAPRDGLDGRHGQDAFVSALLEPEAAVPDDIAPLRDGTPANKRFTVYRNNVVLSLTDNLRAAFPTVAALVGDAFFNAMAGVYVREHPPTTPLMMDYGSDFAIFIEGFPPSASVPYLADMARLEDARRQAYHAADAVPAPQAAFQRLQGADAEVARLVLHPAVRLISSRFPVFSIWQRHHDDDARALPDGGEDVLVVRPQLDVEMYLLGAGEARFIAALGQGKRLGEAARDAGPNDGFDLAAAIARLIRAQAVSAIEV